MAISIEMSAKQGRYFIALWPDEASRNLLAAQAQKLQRQIQHKMRWVDPSQYHVTLKFLGAASEEQLQNCEHELEKIWQKNPITMLATQKILFLSSANPRVFAVSIKLSKELAKLNQLIEKLCVQLDFPVEQKPFIPHITLARNKIGFQFSLQTFMTNLQITRISIVRGEPQKQGAIYSDYANFKIY